MATKLEVLLVQDVLKLGNMGDVVRVASGYARNFLFPYELAIPASRAHKRQVEVLRERASKMEVEREAAAGELKKKLDGLRIRIGARVVSETELFGSIGPRDIVAEIAKLGFKIDTKQVHLHERIKKLGSFEIEVRLHKKVGVTVALEVYNSDPNAPLAETLAPAPVAAAGSEAPAPASAPKAPKTRVKNLGKAVE